MSAKIIQEITLKLRAPEIALKRVAEGKQLPRVFARVALEELQQALKLIETQRKSERVIE